MYSDDPIGIHKRIKKSKIIICGCGGIGSNIAVMLATMGVNDLILIDDDVIEESNLSRQFMYCENDLGLYKVDVLERELLKRDSTLKIQSIKLKFDESIEYIGTADLIVLSGDSFGICKEINSFSYKTNIPFINIGYVMDIAVWGPLVIPGKTACYECFSKQNISDKNWLSYDLMEKIKIINSRFQVPSIGPINSMSLSYAALDIMKYLGAFGSVESINNRVGIWTDNMKIQLQKYSYSDNCSLKCIDFIKLKK